MFTKREWIIFTAGAEAFHTLSHIILALNGLPIKFYNMTITSTFNLWAIIINAVITLGLFAWAKKTR